MKVKTHIIYLIVVLLLTFVKVSAAELSGREIAFERSLGNCLACHIIAGGELAGNIGPPLIFMKVRYKTKELLKAQISDARKKNPHSIMPPFGKYQILTEEQIDKVTAFIYSQ